MRKTTLVHFEDLLLHAEKIGYGWNESHEILVKDGIPPLDELREMEYYLEDLKKTGKWTVTDRWSEDSRKIVISFMEVNALEEMTVI